MSGTVYLDGINLKDINVGVLRKSIGYVGQEPTLFGTTIRGNIQYGNPHATQEQIEDAARLANAHDFITAFPDGYNTIVGDNGSKLSGGQKQVRKHDAMDIVSLQYNSHFCFSLPIFSTENCYCKSPGRLLQNACPR